MKILYIVNMAEKNKGGLYKASYDRIIRHNRKNESWVVHNNYYDSQAIRMLKEKIFKRKAVYPLKNWYSDGELTINNLNFKNTVASYVERKIKMQEKFMMKVKSFFISKYHEELKEADLIHAHWGDQNAYLAYLLGQEYQKPYFLTFHGSDINQVRANEQDLMVEAMEDAEKCFFVSQQLLNNAKGLGYSGSNAVITYNGINQEQFKIPRKKREGNKTVGFVGALKEVKGADLLTELFQLIKDCSKEPIDFTIIGDGVLKDRLQRKAKASHLSISFKGHLAFDQVAEELKTIDLLVVPSRAEGLSLVAIEASAMGIPVVAAKVGGLSEVIAFEENLIERDEEMVERMADRVLSLLKKEEKKSEEYRASVLDKFQWKNIIQKEHHYYQKSLENFNDSKN